MGASLTGVCSIYKGEITVAVIRGMTETKLKGFIFCIDRCIYLAAIYFFCQKIHKTVGGKKSLVVEIKIKAGVKIGVAPQSFTHILIIIGKFTE